MLDGKETENLIRELKEIIYAERQGESSKIELALKSDFNLLDCFRLFDVQSRGSFNLTDFQHGLSDVLQFNNFTSDDCYLFFRRFNSDGHGRLTFEDFSYSILPFSQEYASLVRDRPDIYSRRERNPFNFFTNETRAELRDCLGVIFKTERQMEALRLRLKNRPNFLMRNAFDYLAKTRPSTISQVDMRDQLAHNGFFATERELMGLMYRLDRDRDGYVCYQYFAEELNPKLHF